MTIDLSSARIFSSAIFETYFSYENDMWIAASYYYVLSSYFAISIDGYTSITKLYSFLTFSVQINVAILLLKYLVLIFSFSLILFYCTFYITFKVCSESLLNFLLFNLFNNTWCSVLFSLYMHLCCYFR